MKKINFIALISVICLLLNTGCKKPDAPAAPTFDVAAAKKTVIERGEVFVNAINSKDSVGLANCYTKDAKFMLPNEKAIEGRAAIQKKFGQWMKGGMPQFSLQYGEVWGDENMLAAENTWTFMDQNGKTVDTGKSLEIYKMEDGVWKLHRDCYNSDMPAMPAGK